MKRFIFKSGQVLEYERVIAKTLNLLIVSDKNGYCYIVNTNNLVD